MQALEIIFVMRSSYVKTRSRDEVYSDFAHLNFIVGQICIARFADCRRLKAVYEGLVLQKRYMRQ